MMSNGEQMAFLLFGELKCKYAAQIMLLFAHIVLSKESIELTFYAAIVISYATKLIICDTKRIGEVMERRLDFQVFGAGYVSFKQAEANLSQCTDSLKPFDRMLTRASDMRSSAL